MRIKELKIRGFIEGIEVPIIAASVNIAPNSPASATVQIIATDAAHEIKPRSAVHLFFKDLFDGPGSSMYIAGEGIDTEYTIEKHTQILEEEQYKLLFCGEIVGYQFDKSAMSRQINLQCADFSLYWDTCWYSSSGGFFSPSNLNNQFAMTSGQFFNHLLFSKGEMVYKEFTTPPPGYPGVTGLLGGLIHLLQSVGGVHWSGTNQFNGLNPFFTIAELKYHLGQQIAVADDDGPKKLLKMDGFGSIWNRSIRGLGKNFTYRMVLNALQSYIFYEVFPCPIARFIPGTGIYDEASPSSQLLRNHPTYGYIAIAAGQLQKSVERLIADFMNSTRAITVAEYRSSLTSMNKELKGYIRDIDSKDPVRLGNPRTSFEKAQARIRPLLRDLGSSLPEKGKRYNTVLKSLNYIDDKLRAIYGMVVKDVESKEVAEGIYAHLYTGLTVPGLVAKVGEKKVEKTFAKKDQDVGHPPFLMSQLFRPDVWFCSPPRCNVLFPDQYFNITFSRNYLAEITRLLLRTHSSFFGPDVLFDKYFYAPALPGMKKGGEKPSLLEKSFEQLVKARRDLMEHELYTGVLPKFERAGSHKVLGLKTGTTLAGGNDVGYAQRLANFLFFKYRYAARQLTVSCPFNPYLAPGFPAVILDKPADLDKIKRMSAALEESSKNATSLTEATGTHYLGLIVAMSHNVNQGGGTTSIQLQYARTHREEVEALGADIVPNKVRRPVGKQPVESYVCALNKPTLGDRGLYEGTILEVKEISRDDTVKVKTGESEYAAVPIGHAFVSAGETTVAAPMPSRIELAKAATYSTPKEYPLLGTTVIRKGKKVKWKKKFDTLVRPWTRQPASEFGPEVVSLVGSATTQIEFRLFWIKEDVVRTEETEIDMPLEDIIRPPWYSTIWLNNSIGGAVYNKFFGTGAITDPLTVVDEYGSNSAETTDVTEQNAAMSGVEDEEDVKFDLNILMDLQQGTSIEASVDLLAYTYSVMKSGRYDVEEFIRSYTWRPVASMIDMFGTPDLQLAYGVYQGDTFVPATEGKGPVVAIEGLEGFHSRAFGDYKDLFGLARPDIGSIAGVPNQQDAADARMDVRRERWLRVMAYVLELQERGLLG